MVANFQMEIQVYPFVTSYFTHLLFVHNCEEWYLIMPIFLIKCFVILWSFSLQKHVEFSKVVFQEEVVSPASSLSNFCRIRCSIRPVKFSLVSVDYNGGNLQVPVGIKYQAFDDHWHKPRFPWVEPLMLLVLCVVLLLLLFCSHLHSIPLLIFIVL